MIVRAIRRASFKRTCRQLFQHRRGLKIIKRIKTGVHSYKQKQYYMQHTWVVTHNLPSQSFSQAWQVMAATATQNRRCARPVYVLTIFLHPTDAPKATQNTLISIGRGLILALGVSGHQFMIIGPHHGSTPTVHLAINLIHPDTLRVANLNDDFIAISQYAEYAETLYLLKRQRRRTYNNLLRAKGVAVQEGRSPHRDDVSSVVFGRNS